MNSMSSSIPRNSPYEEDSFIILGSTSPKTSMENAMVESKILENSKGSDLFKMSNSAKSSGGELDDESMLYRAHFNLEQPSPASVEMASAVMLDCHDSSDVQARVVGLIEENTVLRATLKQNNFSMREQFKTIIDWQEDMMKTHQLHKTKFLETKDLIEKLRVDNSKLRKELELLRIEKQMTTYNKDNLDAALSRSTHDSQKASSSSGRDSLVDGLTSQLENVERQRKQVIKDNEKLLADKETLEKELKTLRDLNVELKKIGNVAEEVEAMNMKLKMELESLKQEKATLVNGQRETKVSESSSNSAENSFVITTGARMSSADLENTIDVLTSQLELIERQRRQVINENDKILLQNQTLADELAISRQQNEDLKVFVKGIQNERANINQDDLRNLEAKVSNLQVELKNSQVKLMQSENTKLEFTQHKLESQENIKQLAGSIAELKERLREAHTITFQPIRYSLSLEAQCDSSEFSNFVENVRLYDKLLKDLADYLNQHSQQFCSLFDAVTQLLVDILEKAEDNPSQMKAKLTTIKENLDTHHSAIANYNYQVKSALSALEKMFLDYQQVLKILKDHESKTSEHKKLCRESDSLTARMLAQTEQLKDTQKENAALKEILSTLQKESEERDLLRAQLEIYRCDFEAERDARTQIASEKEEIVSNLQILHRRNQDLTEEVNSFRSRYPHNFGNMTFGRNQSTSASQASSSSNSASASAPRVNALNHERQDEEQSAEAMKYFCPMCGGPYKSMKMLQEHVETCLEVL